MKKKRVRLRKHRVKPTVRCTNRNCMYEWTPNPHRWKNLRPSFNYGNPSKVIFCPACSTRVKIPVEDMRLILIAWGLAK